MAKRRVKSVVVESVEYRVVLSDHLRRWLQPDRRAGDWPVAREGKLVVRDGVVEGLCYYDEKSGCPEFQYLQDLPEDVASCVRGLLTDGVRILDEPVSDSEAGQ